MPIVMSKNEWSRITRWTDTDREDPEISRKREYVKFLNTTSREMTKTWPNSLENVNKRNEELRRARIEASEQANTKFYNKYLKRKKEEQERLMYSARDIVFKNKDAPKLLLSAVIETAIQKERNEQLKFLEEQRRYQAEEKKRNDDDINRKAKEWNELMALRKKRRFEVNKQHQKEILEQAHEVSERNRTEHERELNLQKIDNIKANEQIEAIKEFEENFKAAEKARIWADMERSNQETQKRRREQAARDRMDDRLIQVLLRSRARIDKKRKQTELDVKNEKMRVLEAISKKLESGDAVREAKDQAILNKAIKEKEAVDEAHRQKQQLKHAQLTKERRDARQQWLRDEEQRLNDFNTMRQWQIMNRFKNSELYDDFNEKLRLEKERKIKEYREDILKLWKEREDREARERAETRYFYGELAEKKLRDADNKLFAHAAQLLDEAEVNDRPTYALHRAIDHYCKLNRLYPMPELPASMKEHFKHYAPKDGSKIDPSYREPPPPVQTVPKILEAEPGKRDGMQEPGPSKPKETKANVEAGDYKRATPANGLQRRSEQADLTLPPITVIPCQTVDCQCPLKK